MIYLRQDFLETFVNLKNNPVHLFLAKMEANVVPFGESSIASVKITSLGQTVASIDLEKKMKTVTHEFRD